MFRGAPAPDCIAKKKKDMGNAADMRVAMLRIINLWLHFDGGESVFLKVEKPGAFWDSYNGLYIVLDSISPNISGTKMEALTYVSYV